MPTVPSSLPPRPLGFRRLARRVMAVMLAVAATTGGGGCAGDPGDGTIPAGYPTVADERFSGVFELVEARSGGRTLELVPPTAWMLKIDVVTGAATLDLGCNRRLGSFTLSADGAASFTFTGGNPVEPCPAAESEADVLTLFDHVDRWETIDDGFALVGGGGDRLVLIRI